MGDMDDDWVVRRVESSDVEVWKHRWRMKAEEFGFSPMTPNVVLRDCHEAVQEGGDLTRPSMMVGSDLMAAPLFGNGVRRWWYLKARKGDDDMGVAVGGPVWWLWEENRPPDGVIEVVVFSPYDDRLSVRKVSDILSNLNVKGLMWRFISKDHSASMESVGNNAYFPEGGENANQRIVDASQITPPSNTRPPKPSVKPIPGTNLSGGTFKGLIYVTGPCGLEHWFNADEARDLAGWLVDRTKG